MNALKTLGLAALIAATLSVSDADAHKRRDNHRDHRPRVPIIIGDPYQDPYSKPYGPYYGPYNRPYDPYSPYGPYYNPFNRPHNPYGPYGPYYNPHNRPHRGPRIIIRLGRNIQLDLGGIGCYDYNY